MYLNCHSHFSFNFGTISTERLVQEAKNIGIGRLALTDVNNTAGVFSFAKCCWENKIDPIVGVELRNGFVFCYIGLAQNIKGFENLNRWMSRYLTSKENYPSEAPELEHVVWMYSLQNLPERTARSDEWVGVKPSDLNHWQVRQKQPLFKKWSNKTVAWQPVSFLDTTGFQLHRLLRCIDDNILLSKQKPDSYSSPDETFITPEKFKELYRELECNAMISRAKKLLKSCHFRLKIKQPKNKKVFSESGKEQDDTSLLRKLANEGVVRRYANTETDENEIAKRIDKELRIIHKMGFTSYFLITWDIIRQGKEFGFFHVGRGSGANSIVAYCLGITDVDPITLDLYFERFINPDRSSLPDFDIDFSWDERGRIQDYIFQKYGPENVAMLGSYVTYQRNSILREFGKVLGHTESEIEEVLGQPEKYIGSKILKWYETYGPLMEDMPRHGSIHAGGILISEHSMFRYSALNFPPKGYATTQFDMYVAEDIRFAKFDILSQRGLGHIKEAVDIIYENQGLTVDVHDVKRFLKDDLIANQIRSNETIGCFYIESPAMRQLLSKLKCDDYLTLVAASSIIRPGVAQSGMMQAYIERYHNPRGFEYIHPVMKTLMEETYGIMVYQEDVIKVAHHFAGLTLAEADILRRGMSGKSRARSEFWNIKDKFFANCLERGYPQDISNEVWRQIESFAGYSFSKAHSASYAVESYQSLFLKTSFPKEFMVAVINNFGGFYRTEIYVHEARRSGATIEAPCVNSGKVKTSIKKDTIYLGFQHMKSLESKLAHQIVNERNRNGRFRNLANLMKRVPMGLEQAILLIRIGALRFTGQQKRELFWEAHVLHHGIQSRKPVAAMDLFEDEEDLPFVLPELTPDTPIESAYDELEILDFALCSPFDMVDWRLEAIRISVPEVKQIQAPGGQNTAMSPVWKPKQRALEMIPQLNEDPLGYVILKESQTVKHMKLSNRKVITMYGYLIATKPLRTKQGKRMTFGCFIDHEGQFLDTVHFPPSLERYPFNGKGVYRLTGRATEDFGSMSMEVHQMEKMPRKVNPNAVKR